MIKDNDRIFKGITKNSWKKRTVTRVVYLIFVENIRYFQYQNYL